MAEAMVSTSRRANAAKRNMLNRGRFISMFYIHDTGIKPEAYGSIRMAGASSPTPWTFNIHIQQYVTRFISITPSFNIQYSLFNIRYSVSTYLSHLR
jgi:hypothetical protein